MNCNCPNSSYGKKHTSACFDTQAAELAAVRAERDALRARVVDYERLLSGITENDDVQYDVWLTFCQQARARLARATESANHELVPCSHG